MVELRAVAAGLTEIEEADLLVVPVFKGAIGGPGSNTVLDALGMERVPVTPSFRGDVGQHLLLAASEPTYAMVMLVGLGRMDEVDNERLRRAAGVAGRHTRARRVVTTLAEVHPTPASVMAVAEGFTLGGHEEHRFRSPAGQRDEGSHTERLDILVPSTILDGATRAIALAGVYAEAQIATRRLVDCPPDRKRPAALAAAITDLVDGRCEVAVRDEAWLAEHGFGALTAVGAGSTAPPRLVELHYRPEDPLETVALLGKGITFDSGGLSLKRDDGMRGMKADMAGAATIASVCAHLAATASRIEVVGLLGLAENMPSGTALRPGDVVTAYDGTTIEVLDTDAEGRLVLADLLGRAGELDADAIVDCATLTGSAISALGHYNAAVMGTDDTLVEALVRAGETVGETYWRLPLTREYDRFLDSPVADSNNTGDGPGGGAITAGLFLRRFAGDARWAHLDIAGPAFLSKELSRDYLPEGGTGFGTRMLLAWLSGRT